MPNGTLVLLDKFGDMFLAHPRDVAAAAAAGARPSAYDLDPTPVVRLGAGRPLGFHLDTNGDVIVCDSVKVGPWVRLCDKVSGT